MPRPGARITSLIELAAPWREGRENGVVMAKEAGATFAETPLGGGWSPDLAEY